jgi:hypothetical protein
MQLKSGVIEVINKNTILTIDDDSDHDTSADSGVLSQHASPTSDLDNSNPPVEQPAP